MAVLSCAGAYVSGAAGSNECPAGSVRIETSAACLSAVSAVGKPEEIPFVESESGWPRGCYYRTNTNYASFNSHAVGARNSYSRLLCAAVTTAGAPPMHGCARACANARAAALLACVGCTRSTAFYAPCSVAGDR